MTLHPTAKPSTAPRSADIAYPSAVPFLLVHSACFAAIWTGVTWQVIGLCVSLYCLRMFAVTAGYHRYFSHRSYSTSRLFQFVLALLAQSTAQRSVLWWAAKHRHHHFYADTPEDVHSPRHNGFFYSHVGWLFARRHDVADLSKVPDFARYAELRWLHKNELMPAVLLAGICFLVASWAGLVVGFLWSTVLVYHATFCINSLAHVRGSRRYVTGDDSRNNVVLAILTMGEGWHNNHHACPSSVRQGFRWWEIDASWYVLKLLSVFGIVYDLKTPPERVLRNEHQLGTRTIQRTAEQLANRFNPESIALAIVSTLHASELPPLRAALSGACQAAGTTLAELHAQHLPTRDEVKAQAKAMFAWTRSTDVIVDRGHELLFSAVDEHLSLLLVRL
jgi:stearoyl-CoA desaturase (delta-9 desaturase)